jgi:hypothetical protein
MSDRTEPDPRRLDEIRDDLAETIARRGYEVVNVFGDAEIGGYSYTVGLTDRGLPELIMVGFQTSLMQGLLRDSVPKADNLRDGDVLTGVATVPLGLRRIPQEAADRFLLMAHTHYGRSVEAIQLVIPDAAGRFPWQPGCDPLYIRYQSAFIPFAAEQRASH